MSDLTIDGGSDSSMSEWASGIMRQKYAHELGEARREDWNGISERVPTHVLGAVGAPQELIDKTSRAIRARKFLPGGRYLAATGRPFHQVQNCVLNRTQDSREGWGDHLHKAAMSLMTGAGLGVVYSDLREEGAIIKRTGGVSSGPMALMQATNEGSRAFRQGGDRRGAIWAGLHWWHPDVFKFATMKNWPEEIRALKAKDYNFPAPMDGTNISIILDTRFFQAYNDPADQLHARAREVYALGIRQMLTTADPGFSVDCGENEGENNRNACCEITSRDDSDICNLGSINMARINSLEEFNEQLEIAIPFLLAGTVYSDVPYPKVAETRTKNRRLGLGLMGLHEWLLKRGKKYGQDYELQKYLEAYARSGEIAERWANKWGLSVPIKTRAIAPNGTIGIVAETTTGIEPIFCVAYKRRYLVGETWKYQYVVDPCAKRLIEGGADPDSIEDAYSIDVERRVAFQAWVQQYVDHAISSTINIPAWGSENNNESTLPAFSEMLMRYLPKLRGVTCYPDGARGGQPLTPVKYTTAMKHVGQIFVEQADVCDISKAGSCG